METLTQVQREAIDYSLRSARPNDHRVIRKASRMVRTFCEKSGYAPEQTSACIRDMFDVLNLERNAE